MTASVRIGIIGCGHVTEFLHRPALERVPEIEVVAVSDIDVDRTNAVSASARAYTDAQDLIDDPEVEAVAICTPPRSHESLILATVVAGKPVFVEKPLALDIDACDRLVDAVATAGVPALVGHNLRHHPQVAATRGELQKGRIGRVELVQTVFTSPARSASDAGAWRAAPEQGGDVFFDLAVHDLDLLRFLLDVEVESATAVAVGGPVDRSATIAVRLSDGIVASIAVSHGTIDVHDVRIVGTDGEAVLSFYRSGGPWVRTRSLLGARDHVRRIARDITDLPGGVMAARRGGAFLQSYVEQWRHFASVVRGEESARCSLEDGRHAVAAAARCAEATAS